MAEPCYVTRFPRKYSLRCHLKTTSGSDRAPIEEGYGIQLWLCVGTGRAPPNREEANVAFQGASCGAACTDITSAACSCSQSPYYWSASTYAAFPGAAWLVDFSDGLVSANFKPNDGVYVRAVRGGS